MRKTLAVLLGGVALGFAGQAAAGVDILNIDATTTSYTAPTSYTFKPGSYRLEWIGKADGGAFDAYKLASTAPWRDDFFVTTEPPSLPYSEMDLIGIFVPGGGPKTYASAADALNAYKTTSSFVNLTLAYNGLAAPAGPYAPAPGGFDIETMPWIVSVPHTTTALLWTGDGSLGDNEGGVSLRITALGVPEPSTWALMIGGFGAAGGSLRQRKRAAVPVKA